MHKDFSELIKDFQNTLRNVFNERYDIDQFSKERGIPAVALRDIMAKSPLSVGIPENYGGRGMKVSECLSILSTASYESLSLSLGVRHVQLELALAQRCEQLRAFVLLRPSRPRPADDPSPRPRRGACLASSLSWDSKSTSRSVLTTFCDKFYKSTCVWRQTAVNGLAAKCHKFVGFS